MPRIYIAGAHSRGTTLGHYLTYLDSSLEIVAYLYNNDEKNPSDVNGVPVIRIDETTQLNIEYPVYLGTRGVNHSHLIETLNLCGMKQIIPVDVSFDMDIRNRYLHKYYAECGRDFIKLDDIKVNEETIFNGKTTALFVASSAYDKALSGDYALDKHEKVIQVGTSLCENKIKADYYDNVSENISDRNKQFCELTALYWIWKNATEEIVGLEHYRRHFILPNDWLNRMISNQVDVILPVPLYVSPSIEGNYRSRHEEECWDYMLEYIDNNNPTEGKRVSDFFKETSLYSPCNMFIMKKEILNELCSWVFPILFAVADRGGIIEDSYQNRYPGFISERLITYFFESKRDKYKVIYADKDFRQ